MGGRSKAKEETQKRIVKRLPHYGRFAYARLGYFSLTTKEAKFISEEDAITIENETETPGYFFGKFMRGLRTAKRFTSPLDLSYPYKAIPGKYPSAVYIDIRHAFRQIATAFGMEVFVEEGRFVAYGETIPSVECFSNKICRGLLVTGVSREGTYQEWKENDLRTVRFSNPHYSPHIQQCIWSTLHAVQTVLSPYTVYGHTDGVIAPRRHASKVMEVLDNYGFNYTVKGTGVCQINGVGSYRVGNVETRLHLRPQGTRVYVREDNSKWWLEKFANGIRARKSLNSGEFYGGNIDGTEF